MRCISNSWCHYTPKWGSIAVSFNGKDLNTEKRCIIQTINIETVSKLWPFSLCATVSSAFACNPPLNRPYNSMRWELLCLFHRWGNCVWVWVPSAFVSATPTPTGSASPQGMWGDVGSTETERGLCSALWCEELERQWGLAPRGSWEQVPLEAEGWLKLASGCPASDPTSRGSMLDPPPF